MIKVLHVLGSMNPGGVETWLMHVLRHIDLERFHLDFCTFGPEPGLYAPEIEEQGGKILRCPKGQNVWWLEHRFRRILRCGRYQIVHSHVHHFSGAVLRWAEREGVRVRVAHSHSASDGKRSTLLRRAYRRLMVSWLWRYATHGLAASRIAALNLYGIGWEADGRFRLLYYGIDARPFEVPVDRAAVRRELGIPLNAPVVGHVGRFVEPKNLPFFLRVARKVLNARPDAHFLLVGDGPLRSRIETQSRQLGLSRQVHFTGCRQDVPRLLIGAMDVFLFPSLWEGLPVALIEAQAAGLPAVVSGAVTREATFMPERVEYLSLSTDPGEWAIRVMRWFETPRLDPGAAVWRVGASPFSVQQSVASLSEVYQSAVNSPNCAELCCCGRA